MIEYKTLVRMLAVSSLCSILSLQATAESTVSFQETEGALQIRIDDQVVAEYVWQDPDLPRPYFKQITTLDGIQVSRNYPPDPVVDKGNDDHGQYHPGVWLAFGDAAGADFWRNKARVRHVEFTSPPEGGEGKGTFTVVNAYETTDEPPKTLFTETCAYTFAVGDQGYVVAAESEFKPEGEGFAFGDQEEMGFGVRLATPLRVKSGGFILNSNGGQQEAGTWGKGASWCAGFGNLNGMTAGMAVMTSPKNFRPSWFHSRDYGLIVANPFGKKAMTGPKDDTVPPDATPVAKDGSLKLGFGVYVFSVNDDQRPDFHAMYRAYQDTLD